MPDAKVDQEQEMQQRGAQLLLGKNGKAEQMCCDGKRTAAEHRAESGDKCCSDA